MVKQIATHLLLLGLLFSLVAALPATKPPSISLTLEEVSRQLNNTHFTPQTSSQVIHYSVPQTQIALVIYTGNPIGGPVMRNTLEACLSAAHAAVSKHGDVYMFPDPYVFRMPPALFTGLEITAHSIMVPGLKWVDLANALQGIEQAMWQRAIYKEAQVKMYDEPSGAQMGIVDLHRSSTIHLAVFGGRA